MSNYTHKITTNTNKHTYKKHTIIKTKNVAMQGGMYLQTNKIDCSILFKARSQLASIPMACRLYLESKKLAAADECSRYKVAHSRLLYKLEYYGI